MEKVRRRLMTLLLSLAVIISYMPMSMITAYAAAGDTPTHYKNLTDNQDGTYTLSLDIVGESEKKPNNVNVIVIMDTSGSMTTQRMNAAKNAVNSLATALYAYNTQSEPDTVEMALVRFATSSSVPRTPTSNEAQFHTAVNNLPNQGNGGTNWEAALQSANNDIDFGDNDQTFAVFVSDGNPTFRTTQNGWNDWSYQYQQWGNGQETTQNIQRCYTTAVDDAQALATKVTPANFFTIGAFGDVDRMEQLTDDAGSDSSTNYYSAQNTAALNQAIADILAKIEMAGFADAEVDDGTTNQVESSSGEVAELLELVPNFKYYRSGGDYGSMQPWSDAPEAKIVDGEVIWDLSEVGVLENGVRYTVTFDCYPSQTTYDVIAGLKNGDITYGDTEVLPEEAWQYIVDNGGGSYSLRTNTNAGIKWDDTRDDAGRQESSYINPNPVATDAETLTAKKEWEGGDPDIEELDITVLMDEEPFHEDTISDDNEWETESFISIGIIKDGKVLPGAEGHDFKFAELGDEQYHWELETPTVHPMLIDGTKTMLIMEDDAHPVPSGADTYTINNKTYYADTSAAGLTAINHRRSNLNLKKAVMGEDAPEDATFPFTITVNNSKAPKTEPTDDPEHNSDYWVWFSVDSDPSESFSPVTDIEVSGNGVVQSGNYWYAPSGTAITVNGLKADWNLRFTNLPSGSTYTITEGTMPDGFIFNKAELTAGEGVFSGGQTSTGTITNTKTSYEVTYTNEYARVNINVDKVWDDANDQAGFRPDELTLTLNGVPSGTTAPEPEITKSEDGNTWSYVWKDLPKYDAQGNEIQYTVTENQVPEHYECTGSPASDGGTITNKHTPEVVNVTVVKEWDDDDNIGNIRPTSIQAQLKAGDTASGNPVTLNEGNEWTYTWENLPKYKNGTEIVYTADETAVPTGYEKSGPEKSTAEDGTVTFTVTNTYNPTPVRKAFKATKTTSGYPAGGKNVTFTFTLTPATGAPGTAQTKELTLSGAKPSGEVNFDEIEFTKPGVFEYTVAETAGTADGWTYATNTYKVTVTVRDDGTGKLTASVDGGDNISFNNEYEPEGTEVTLSGKKTLNGRAMEAGEFSFKLSTKSGEAVETVQNTDTDGNYAFSALTFDTAGTYEYVIEEVNNGRPNVTYDTKKYNVTITVTDDGSGKLSAAISGDVNAQGNNANFTNSYEASPTSVKFSGIKNISGYPSAGKDVTFTFTLTPGEGAPGSAQTKTVTLNGNTTKGDILFDAINFDAVGEYKYTIAETKGSTPGWTYSTQVYEVTVSVTDDPDTGKLVATISGLNKDGSGADFQNTYQASPTSITIVGKKTMVNYGKTLEADKFSFTITGEGEREKPAAPEDQATDEQPTDQTTDEQSSDQATDEQPTDQATDEQPADQATDEQPTDQAADEQPAESAPEAAPEENAEPAEGNDTITGAIKSIKGYFTVYALDETTKEMEPIEDVPLPDPATVKNQEGGRIEFGTIEFKEPGTYTYTITESGSMPGVNNDPNPKKTFTVEVTDDGTGTLKAKASPEGEFLFEFKNTYVTPPTPSSVTDQIKITKKLVGHDLEEGFFKFQMLDKSGKVVSTGTNDKDGVVTFAPVTFTEAGNFEYTVQEVDKKSEVIHCDTTPYTVTAKVTNNYDGEKLVVEWDYSGGDSITITNTYSDVVAIDPPVQKIVEGSPDTTETYTFMLEAVTAGAPMPSAAGGASSMTMNITGTGAKEFGVINYTEPGEYTYKVTEVAGSNPDCEYDGSVYTVTAKVTEDPKTYKLSVKTTYTKDGVAVDTAVFKFVNTYPDEPEDSDKPDTGDRNDVAGMLGLMGASAAGLIYMFIRRRREDILG